MRAIAPFSGVAGLGASVLAGLLGGVPVQAWADRVSVDAPLKLSWDGTNRAVFWQLPSECGTNLYLQGARTARGPWSTAPNAAQPFLFPLNQGSEGWLRTVLETPKGSPTLYQIRQAIRDFAFASRTNLNPRMEFDIRVEPVRGLWEQLQIVAVVVRESLDDQFGNTYACVLHEGKAQGLGQSFGGWGLLSGLMQGETFYFTYSQGSGRHRSHVGKLQLVDNAVKLWDAGGFYELDLFLSRQPDGHIVVVSGVFEAFNRYAKSADYARIDKTDPSATKLIGLDGGVLATLLPVGP